MNENVQQNAKPKRRRCYKNDFKNIEGKKLQFEACVFPFVSSFVIEEAVSIYDLKNCRVFVQIHLSKGSRNQSDTQGTSIVYLSLYPYKPSCSTLLHFISALKNFCISFLLVPKSSFSSVQK